MSWTTKQSLYKESRDSCLSGSRALFQLQEQEEFFLTHKDALDEFAKEADENVKAGVLQEDVIGVSPVSWNPCRHGYDIVYVILRDGGYVYFGRNEAFAILGLGGRCKDGKVEFYDQYKDQIDDVGTKYEKQE